MLFSQRFGALRASGDGLVTVGVAGSRQAGWKIYYASSALTRADHLNGKPRLSPAAAWARAADAVAPLVSVGGVKSMRKRGSWTTLRVQGSRHPQLSRLVALPTPRHGVVPAYETYVVDGLSSAFKQFVDARNGTVIAREDVSYEAAAVSTTPFSGSFPATDGGCGPQHGPFVVPANTVSLDIVATATLPANDIVLRLYRGTTLVQAADTATSPEVIHYEPAGGVTAGNYFVQVCEFEDGAAPTAPTTYSGTFVDNDAASVTPLPYPPRWKLFPANPALGGSSYPWNYPNTDIRKVWCWDSNVNGTAIPGCDAEVGNLASRVPWDHDATVDLPTFTTRGNNANSGEAWTNPLAPGAFGFQPTSTQRNYTYPWTNSLAHEQLRTDQHARSRCQQRHLGGRDQPVRDAQPHARLVVFPRFHRGELECAAGQLRPDREDAAERRRHR